MTLEGMYGLFFGSRIKCPDTTEDAGLNCNHPDTHVSNYAAKHVVFSFVIISFWKIALGQDWVRKAKMIRCSTPLPEGSSDPVLARMLEHALY